MSESMGKRVGVVLSGCGVNDGAEIHEATLTLLSLDRAGAHVVAMAPNVAQMHVVDHVAGAPTEGEQRGEGHEAERVELAREADRDDGNHPAEANQISVPVAVAVVRDVIFHERIAQVAHEDHVGDEGEEGEDEDQEQAEALHPGAKGFGGDFFKALRAEAPRAGEEEGVWEDLGEEV